MKIRTSVRLLLSIVFLSISCLSVVHCSSSSDNHPADANAGVDMTDEDLTALVKQAYTYAYPVSVMYQTRYKAVYDDTNPNRADLNQFMHLSNLKTYADRDVTTPNNDTLNSYAWLDLSEEPIVLSVPADPENRYYVVPLMDFYTNVFDSVGISTTGTAAGDYVIVGPDWTGDTPQGLPVIQSPTDWVWIIARTLVNGPDDLDAARTFQHQYQLTPLSVWNGTSQEGLVQTDLDNPPLAPDASDPWNFFDMANLGMTENPPPDDEGDLMAEFAEIGVGSGQTFDPDRFTAAQQQVVQTAMQSAFSDIYHAVQTLPIHAGWVYPPLDLGNYGDDYLVRAGVALAGLGALEPSEAYYFVGALDSANHPFDSSNTYILHFPADGLPPLEAHGFWSLTMYEVTSEGTLYLTQNPIDRYSIGDRTPELHYNADGSLDIYIQKDSPGTALESNWLPTPASGPFRLELRAYLPGAAVSDGTYRVPGVEKQ